MHTPKIPSLILITLLGFPIHTAAEPTPARASQVAAPTATAADTERTLELKVLEKSLEMERKLLESHKEAVSGQQKSVDWWIAFISFAMAVVALLGGVIPYIFYRRESESLKEKQNELAKSQQEADKQLSQAKELCKQAEKHSKEAEQHLSEIINIRQTAEQHADDIEKMKNVTLGNPSTESDADNKAGIQAANELKENREIPLIEQLRAKALVLSHTADIQANTTAYKKALTAWESVLLEKEDDVQANFGAAYYQQQLAKLGEGAQKVHNLAKSSEYYSRTLAIKPNLCDAANNWGNVLSEEAVALANDGRLKDALEKWELAGKLYQQALVIKPDYYYAANNWGNTLSKEAQALANNGRLNDALEKWMLAGECYQQALDIKSDFSDAANNWGYALNVEANALANDGRLNDALEKWKLASERHQQALTIKHDDYHSAYNWGIALCEEANALANDGRLNDALEKWKLAGERYQQALDIKPDFSDAANNWGYTLNVEANALAKDGRLNDALEKWQLAGKRYQQALNIQPDFSTAALNRSITLLSEAQALAQTGRKQKAHNKRQQALELLSNFIQKHPERTAELSYNLACVHALNNQTEQAIQALETCRQSGCLPDKAHIETDKDLDPIRNSEAFQAWFQQAFPENTPN